MAKNHISKLDSYALMIIALSALFVSIWQVNLQRKHDRIAIMPYLEWKSEKNEQGFTSLIMKNKGFGPAIIQKGLIHLEDTIFRDWAKAISHLDPSVTINQSTVMGGEFTLLPGEEMRLVTAKGGDIPISLSYKVEFENLYGDEYDDEYSHVGYPFR